jgi:hypothetical protein
MTEDKMAQVKRTITALEKNGSNWTSQMVFSHVGGSYGELVQYLKSLRTGEVGPATRRQARESSNTTSVYQGFCVEQAVLTETIAELDPDDIQSLPVLSEAKTRLELVEARLPALEVEAAQYEATQRRQKLIAENMPIWA